MAVHLTILDSKACFAYLLSRYPGRGCKQASPPHGFLLHPQFQRRIFTNANYYMGSDITKIRRQLPSASFFTAEWAEIEILGLDFYSLLSSASEKG